MQRLELDLVKEIKGELVPPDFCFDERHGKIEYYKLDRVNAYLLKEKQFAISLPDDTFSEESTKYILRGTYVLDNHPIKLDEPRHEMKRDILSVIAHYSYCTRTEILWALRFIEFRRRKDNIKTRFAKNAIMGRTYHDSVLRTIKWLLKKGYIDKEKYHFGQPVTYKLKQHAKIMSDVRYLTHLTSPFEQKEQIMACLLDLKLINPHYEKIANIDPETKRKLYGFTSESSNYIKGKKHE